MTRLTISIALFASVLVAAVGCGPKEPSDADQQKMAQDFSSENVAKELEKQGKQKEADELRRGAGRDQQ